MSDSQPTTARESKRPKNERPSPPEEPGRCHFFVARRNRYCTLRTKATESYCGEHAVFASTGSQTAVLKRVPCPLDPSHTINIKDLEKHMKYRCNSRPPEVLPAYYKENFNTIRQPDAARAVGGVDPLTIHSLNLGTTENRTATNSINVTFAYKKRSKLYHELIQQKLGKTLTVQLPSQTTTTVNGDTRPNDDVTVDSKASTVEPSQNPSDTTNSELQVQLTPSSTKLTAATPTLVPFPTLSWKLVRSLADRARATYEAQVSHYQALLPPATLQALPADTLFRTEILDHPALTGQRQKKTWVKHVVQQASLLGQMEKHGLLNPLYHFVEFGAGKGELTTYVQHALVGETTTPKSKAEVVPCETPVPFTLVDRRNFRNKFDKFASHTVQRLEIDIKDLDLAAVDGLLDRPIVAYSKHLCGAATDLTLRCLEQFQRKGGRVAGVLIALCCHHACDQALYVNPDYLERANVDDEFFQRLTSMSGWATCGKPKQRGSSNLRSNQGDDNEEAQYLMDCTEREVVGRQCKRILDFGRAEYLKNNLALNPELIYYITQEASLENLALIALPASVSASDS
ncbi:tRNA:m4X modification enzyme [Dispira parvispora]|uniref:tRNA:m(4)X modification enzyme TRM13 n=1 Tax=Dispira parvispora TaxID=1520584 RepID=A0A9W8AWS1_9FUNG|nr:tRNA:m4X modification enzyme [Dispira parvispora]